MALPEPADMRTDDGAIDRAPGNSYSAGRWVCVGRAPPPVTAMRPRAWLTWAGQINQPAMVTADSPPSSAMRPRGPPMRIRVPKPCKPQDEVHAADSPGGPGWSQMWSHPPEFAGVRRDPSHTVSPRHGRSRTPVNVGQHCWKACKGQPFRSSNLLSSANLTCKNIGLGSRYRGPSWSVVSFGGLSFERWGGAIARMSHSCCAWSRSPRTDPNRVGARRRSVHASFIEHRHGRSGRCA
jgi:hypothetical protein